MSSDEPSGILKLNCVMLNTGGSLTSDMTSFIDWKLGIPPLSVMMI